MWRAKQIKTNTKLRIFNSNVKAVLLYGSETWRSTQKTLTRIQIFINKCLRRILHLKWTDKISNTTLWKMTKQLPIENEIKKRKWRWIGHTLRKPKRKEMERMATERKGWRSLVDGLCSQRANRHK